MARVFSISIPEDLYKKALEITGKDKIQDAIRELLKRAIYGGNNVNIQGLEEKFKILDKLANEIADIKAEILSLKEEIRKLEIQQRKHSSYHQHPQASSYNKKEFFLKMDTNIEGVTFALGYSPKLKTVCIYAVTDKKTYNLGKLVVKYTDMGTRIGFDINKFEKVIEEMCHELGYEKSDINGELDRYMEYLEDCKEEVYNVLAKYGLSEDNIKIVEEY